tara:strand:+ start:300 stop:779 length:480 start_codon:yes stop_codon:yes gene_type:complete
MSDFMFGGSALTLDISAVNATGGSVQRGDILQISLLNADAPDTHKAVVPVLSNTGVSQLAPMGVVVAPEGLEIADGDGIILRMLGRCDVLGKVSTTYSADDVVQPENGKTALNGTKLTLGTNAYQQELAGGRLRGVVLKTKATAASGRTLVDCFVSGLP